jgi:hypothetical protein
VSERTAFEQGKARGLEWALERGTATTRSRTAFATSGTSRRAPEPIEHTKGGSAHERHDNPGRKKHD